jgi:hypothetical protein
MVIVERRRLHDEKQPLGSDSSFCGAALKYMFDPFYLDYAYNDAVETHTRGGRVRLITPQEVDTLGRRGVRARASSLSLRPMCGC